MSETSRTCIVNSKRITYSYIKPLSTIIKSRSSESPQSLVHTLCTASFLPTLPDQVTHLPTHLTLRRRFRVITMRHFVLLLNFRQPNAQYIPTYFVGILAAGEWLRLLHANYTKLAIAPQGNATNAHSRMVASNASGFDFAACNWLLMSKVFECLGLWSIATIGQSVAA